MLTKGLLSLVKKLLKKNRLSGSAIKELSSAAFLLSLLCVGTAWGALTPKEMESKLEESKILPGEKIEVQIDQEEAVARKKKPAESKELERDCKIEAILISKTIMSADSSIKKVRVRFADPKDPLRYEEILVRAGDILAFASGSLSEKDLLASLDLTLGGTSSASLSVVDGPEKEKRANLFARISELDAKGINTKAYMEQFKILEESAKKGDKSQVEDSLDRLGVAVDDQLKALALRGKRPVLGGAVSSNGAPAGTGTTKGTVSESPQESTTSESAEDKAERLKRLLLSKFMGGGQGGEDGGADTAGLKQMMHQMVRTVHGDLTPVPGIYESDRSLISAKISKKKQYGYDVSKDMQFVRTLNAAVQRNDAKTTVRLINEAFAYLHISNDEVKYWRQNFHGLPYH